MDFLSDSDRLEQGEFRGVAAWQRAMDFTVAIYRLTDGWPRVDPLDLVQEMRRNAVILPSVIARGFGMGEREALLDCLQTVLDTARQLDAQLGTAVRVGYSDTDAATALRGDLSETVQEIEALKRRYQGL
jgi:four helix bundle protein